MQTLERLKNNFWVSFIVLPIITGVISSAIAGWWAYGYGYSDGFEVGKEEGTTAYIKTRESEFDQMRNRLQETLKKEEAQFKEQLRSREAEFDKNFEKIVQARFKHEIQTVRSACDKEIENLKDLGLFWREYSEQVAAWRLVDPQTEQELRATARAIVSIAYAGRKAAMEIAGQLNGLVDDIGEALERGDLDKVKELIFALEQSLPAKELLWQRNFRFIVTGEKVLS